MNYGDPSYWDLRYKAEKEKALQFELFDWYLPFDLVYPMLESTIELTGKQKILVVGVGRSNVIRVLYGLGYRDITAIDISPTIIAQMQDTHSQCAGVDFLVMDVMELNSFADSSFSLVIDKGCIDALFCRTDYESCVSRSFKEIFRVLKKETGVFASISHAPPLTRVAYMRQAAKWSIDATPMLDGEHITLYTLLRTTNEVLLARRIDGGDPVLLAKSSMIQSSLDTKMNKASYDKKAGGGGMLSVTADVSILEDLVNESSEVDGDK